MYVCLNIGNLVHNVMYVVVLIVHFLIKFRKSIIDVTIGL